MKLYHSSLFEVYLYDIDHSMGDFGQKEKKKMPQNKPGRAEPCLPRCNTSSMVGSADPRNVATLIKFISSAMRTF